MHEYEADPIFPIARDLIIRSIARSAVEEMDMAVGWVVTTSCMGSVSLIGPFENPGDGLVYAAEHRAEMEREFPGAGWRVDVLPLLPAESIPEKKEDSHDCQR